MSTFDDERIGEIVNAAFGAETERTVAGILDALDERERALTAFKAGDYATALPIFERCAKYGDAEVHNSLGRMYARGWGLEKDDVQAARWFRQAAEEGHAAGQANLGGMYLNGLGVPKDEVAALQWFQKAAEQGLAVAQYNLGWVYANGKGVSEKDPAEACRWFRLAAEQDYSLAQNDLGLMYLNGLGVPKDEAEALSWIRRAAAQGLAKGQYSLGWMYENGRGVPEKDPAEAYRWFSLAAENGHAAAQSSLGYMYSSGNGVPEKDDVAAVRWFRQAAKQGESRAQTNLSWMYVECRGGVPSGEEQELAVHLIQLILPLEAKIAGQETVENIVQAVEYEAVYGGRHFNRMEGLSALRRVNLIIQHILAGLSVGANITSDYVADILNRLVEQSPDVKALVEARPNLLTKLREALRAEGIIRD